MDTDLAIMFVYIISTLQDKKASCYVYNVVFKKKEGHSSGNRFCTGQAPKPKSKSRPTKSTIGPKGKSVHRKGPAKKGPNPKVQKFLSKKNGTLTS